jgi:hypothetical protein
MAKVKLNYKAIYDICKKAEVEPIWAVILQETEKRQGYIEIENDGLWHKTMLYGAGVKLHKEWILEWL